MSFEIINAIITNPLEAIGLFGVSLIIYKLFFARNGIFNDDIRHLKWSMKYDLDKQLENLFDWLDRRDKAYQDWAKTKTRKQFLKMELTIWSCLLGSILVWNIFFAERSTIGMILVTAISIEFIGIFLFSLYRYKHPKKPKQEIQK